MHVRVFSDRDILTKQPELEEALRGADVFFGSLLFDYDQVEWLRERVQQIPIRLVFESALELMGTTQLGGFKVLQRFLGFTHLQLLLSLKYTWICTC